MNEALFKEFEAKKSLLKASKDFFTENTKKRREAYCERIVEDRDSFYEDLLKDVPCSNTKVFNLLDDILRYAQKNDWVLIDVVNLMVCVDNPMCEYGVAKNLLVYQSFRMADDLLDGHTTYKGMYPTLYGQLKEGNNSSELSVLSTLLMLSLTQGFDKPTAKESWRHTRNTLIGAIQEVFCMESCDLNEYKEMVEGKMVSYGQMLYAPVVETLDTNDKNTLNDFLKVSFFVSQVINDYIDQEDDAKINQPNFWALVGDMEEATRLFRGYFSDLEKLSLSLTPRLKNYADSRLFDLINYILKHCRKR